MRINGSKAAEEIELSGRGVSERVQPVNRATVRGAMMLPPEQRASFRRRRSVGGTEDTSTKVDHRY